MSDYARANTGGATHFTDKDALTTGDPNKVIVGSQFDAEFNAILTAANSKYDSDDLASQAQAEAGTANTVLMTPLRTEQWSATWAAENAGAVGDIQALADPGADEVLFWDDSDGAIEFLSMGTGLAITANTLNWSASGIAGHDTFTDFVADEHVAHSGVTITAGSGLTGGGTIAATRTINVGAGSGITVNADDVALTNVTAATTRPYILTSGTWSWDGSSLTSFGETTWVPASDYFYISDGGTNIERIAYQDLHMHTQTAQTSQTLAAADCNSIMEFNGTATITIPADATHSWPPGGSCLICVDHATQEVTVTVSSTAVLNSIFHPGGATSVSDTVLAGGTAALIYLGSDQWYLVGDIAT